MRQRPKHAAPKTPAADVPAELRSTGYGFPRVKLPAPKAHVPAEVRPLSNVRNVEQLVLRRDTTNEIEPCELRFEKYSSLIVARFYDAKGRSTGETNHPIAFSVEDLIDHYWPRGWNVAGSLPLADDDTQPLTPVSQPKARIVDPTPQPVRIEGLTPASAPSIPLPSLPFLNAGAHVEPQPSPRAQVIVREGSALPPRLTGAELMILGQPVPNDAPPAPRPRGVFHTFEQGFWTRLHQHTDRAHAVAESLTAANDRRDDELSERLARLEQRHRDMIAQHEARPLPRRTPGASLALEAGSAVSA